MRKQAMVAKVDPQCSEDVQTNRDRHHARPAKEHREKCEERQYVNTRHAGQVRPADGTTVHRRRQRQTAGSGSGSYCGRGQRTTLYTGLPSKAKLVRKMFLRSASGGFTSERLTPLAEAGSE